MGPTRNRVILESFAHQLYFCIQFSSFKYLNGNYGVRNPYIS